MNTLIKLTAAALSALMLSASAFAEDIATVTAVSSDAQQPSEGDFPVLAGDSAFEVSSDAQQPAVDTALTAEGYFRINGYPDYVSYVYEAGAWMGGYDPSSPTDGNESGYLWEVGITDPTEENKQEITQILSQLHPDAECKVEFKECTISYAERDAMRLQIRDKVEQISDKVICSTVLLSERSEAIIATISFKPDENGVSDYDEEEFQRVKDELVAQFGDYVEVLCPLPYTGSMTFDENGGASSSTRAVSGPFDATAPPDAQIMETADEEYDGGEAETAQESAEAAPELTDEESAEPEPEDTFKCIGVPKTEPAAEENSNQVSGENSYPMATAPEMVVTAEADASKPVDPFMLCACAILAIAAAVTLIIVLRAKKTPVLTTADGSEVTAPKSGTKQVEEAVKNAEVTPDDKVFEEIVKKIENS